MVAKPQLTPIPITASVYDPEAVFVRLGSKDYPVREVPIPRLKRFKTLWVDVFAKLTLISDSDDIVGDAAVDTLFALLDEAPLDLLAIAIPDVDRADAGDEDHGWTVPQVITAFEAILKVNRLEVLKQAVPTIQAALRMQVLRKQAERARTAYEQAEAIRVTTETATATA